MAMKGVLHILQISRNEASLSGGWVSYPRQTLKKSCPSAEMQLAYSTAPADWAKTDFKTKQK